MDAVKNEMRSIRKGYAKWKVDKKESKERRTFTCLFSCVWVLLWLFFVTVYPDYFSSLTWTCALFIFIPLCCIFNVCIVLSIWQPFWYDNKNGIGHPTNYRLMTGDNMYINHFRAKLRRTAIDGDVNYNRAISMWTIAKYGLALWITFDIINIIFIATESVSLSPSLPVTIVLIVWYACCIVTHLLCLRGIFLCIPAFICIEVLINILELVSNGYLTAVTNGGHVPLLLMGACVIIPLLCRVHSLSLFYRHQKDRPTAEDAQIIKETDTIAMYGDCGSMNIKEHEDGVIQCTATSTYPSIMAKCAITAGKWYYEVELTGSYPHHVQIGWSKPVSNCTEKRSSWKGIGIGTTKDGWAYNPSNQTKCHDWTATAYGTNGEFLKLDSVVGCYVDLDDKIMRFSHNGHMMAVAFHNFLADNQCISPACSIKRGGSFKIFFDEKHFKYPHLRLGYTAISKAFDPTHSIAKKPRVLYPLADPLQEENKYDDEGAAVLSIRNQSTEEEIEIVIVENQAKTELNNNDQDSAHELPYGWTSAYANDGKLYYQNNITKKTQWEKPMIDPELPYGWRAVFSANGKVYYQNDCTQQTSWTKPMKPPMKSPIRRPIQRPIQPNAHVLTNKSIKESVAILTDALSARFNHSGFDINEYIYIHGGACRDVALGRADNIKDIDLFVELNKIHIHAMECTYGDSCALSSAYNKNKKEYEAIWKMCTQSFVWRSGPGKTESYKGRPCSLTNSHGGVFAKHHNPEERKSIELLVMSICHEFVTSDCIINTRYLLKEAIKDARFRQHCRTIKGPNPKSLNVVTYTIHLNNGVDLDIMDCSVFISYFHAVQILTYAERYKKELHWAENYNVMKKDMRKRTKKRFVYPITHEDKVKYVDCTINAICIKLSSVIGVDVPRWGQHIMEPYRDIKTCHKEVDAINDLRQSILRPYYDCERAREKLQCNICYMCFFQCLGCCNSEKFDKLMLHDLAQSESILGSVSSTADSGQAELLIFRIMKAAHKLKDQVKPIKISSKYCDVMENTYSMWFDVNKLLNGVKYNKNTGKEENKLDAVLRHVFNHNYFRNGKIAQSYVVGIYHILKYDRQLVEYYEKYQEFRIKLDEAVKQYNAQTLWNEIQTCAKSKAEFYPINGGANTVQVMMNGGQMVVGNTGNRLFQVVKH